MPCAAMPANSARVRSSVNALVASACRRPQRLQSESREREGMAGKGRRSEHRALEPRPVVDDRADRLPVGVARRAPALGRSPRAIAPPAPRCHRRTDGRASRTAAIHSSPCAASGSVRQNGDAIAERMNGRADVVDEAGQRQFGRAHAAADGLVGLEDDDLASGLRQHDGRAQAVRPRTDDDGVNHANT